MYMWDRLRQRLWWWLLGRCVACGRVPLRSCLYTGRVACPRCDRDRFTEDRLREL